MKLSIVIVARNEEKNIARCIESILQHTANINGVEVLLADSASTDSTVAIASKYPISIISLKPGWPLSPSAGRFCGVNNTSGEYVMIVDGDMELQEGWVEHALAFLDAHPNVASAVGKSQNIWPSGESDYGEFSRQNHMFKVDYVFASSVFRRDALDKVGNFQPYLRAEEEAEISSRLTKAGYELYFLPFESMLHFRPAHPGLQEIMRRARKGLWRGMGDMFSWCFYDGSYGILLKRFKTALMLSMVVFVEIAVILLAFVTHKMFWIAAGILLPVSVLLLLCILKRSIIQGVLSAMSISVITWEIFCGLFRRIQPTSSYPLDVIWVKRQPSQ